MSATPPPPPPSSTSSTHGRPSAGSYRAPGSAAAGHTRQRAQLPANPTSFFAHPGGLPTSTAAPSDAAGSTLRKPTSTTTTAEPPAPMTHAQMHATSPTHVDPTATAQPTDPAPPSPSPISAHLLRSLTAAVHESLAAYLHHDAIDLAQRLFHLDPSFPRLHLLAHCYVLSGAVGTAYRLLHHHYPFFEVHVTRPRTAAHGSAGGTTAGASAAAEGAPLPLDGRRAWTAAAAAGGAAGVSGATSPQTSLNTTFTLSGVPGPGENVDLSVETVDLKAQWECQYLLGVCCYRTQHYEDGVKVLSQLLYVKLQLDAACGNLRKLLQQQPQRGNTADIERQLRVYSFATDARLSQVCYWLGLCEKHRQRPPIAAGYFRRSFASHPTRLDAFQEYIRMAWPSETSVQELLTVKEPLAEEEEDEGDEEVGMREDEEEQHLVQHPPQRRGRDVSSIFMGDEEERAAMARTKSPLGTGPWVAAPQPSPSRHNTTITARQQPDRRGKHSAASASLLDAPALTAAQRRSVQQHLQPLLRAQFLGLTYRCPEAVEALQNLLLQHQQQAAAATTSTPASANRSGGLGDRSRPGFSRFPAASSSSPTSLSCSGPQQVYGSVVAVAADSARVRPANGASPFTPAPLLRQLALAQFHNGDVQESADTFDRLLRAAPWDLTSTSLIYYSTALWHLKCESALGGLAQRLTDAEPFSPTTFCVVANAYSLIKDPRDALVMLKRAVQLAPTLAYAHALHGYELLGQDNKAEAEVAFKTALAVDHTLYIAYAGLGERFIRDEQVDRARGYYKEAIKINPTPAIMNRFALTYHRQNNSPTHLKCALRLYSESLLRHPNNVTARRQRTDVLLRLDRAKEAMEELKALLVQCPGEAAIYMTLAECMVCLRRPQEALQHYQTAMHLDPRRESYVQGCIDRLVAANML